MIIFLFVLCLILLIYSLPIWLRNRRAKQWQQSLNLIHHQLIFDRLFAGINGFNISKNARQKNDDIAFVYGEITFQSFIAVLSNCQINSQSIFYDLGSGTGKAVIACSMVYNVRKSYGIELFKELHDCAQTVKNQLLTLPEYEHTAKNIHFICADIYKTNFTNATHIFVNATGFFGDMWQQLSRHLEQVLPGTYVITASKAIMSEKFAVLKILICEMSWGLVQVYIQQCIK